MEPDSGSPEVPRNMSPDIDDMSKPYLKVTKDEPVMRRVICRYGPGCTHISDPSHREKFWHPRPQKLNDEQLRASFICNECGFASNHLPDMQLHLKRKTAWSNQSLVGCRINCLVDCKEWHEGFVSQFHKSGKHLIEFRSSNDRRWLHMKKVAFYIVERPANSVSDTSEFKDSGDGGSPAPFEESWVFAEDISVDFAFAQSVLFKIYGNVLQETGHMTRGHVCLTEVDRVQAQLTKSSLLYGELLPRGANKAFGTKRLDILRAATLFDLGMGTGKLLIHAFLQFRNLRYIYGVELSAGRYALAEEAVLKMVELLGAEHYHVQMNPGNYIIVTEAIKLNGGMLSHEGYDMEDEDLPNDEYGERVLHFQCGNMFDVANIDLADVVMMETDIPADVQPNLCTLLGQMKDGSRILTYLDLRRIFDVQHFPFRQLESNRQLSDRYPTSWSVQRGHHFFLWTKSQVEAVHATSSWGFGSLVSADSVVSSQDDNSPSSGHVAGATSTGGGVNGTAQTAGSRCLPFGMRYLFGGSSSSNSNNNNNNNFMLLQQQQQQALTRKRLAAATAVPSLALPLSSTASSAAAVSTGAASPVVAVHTHSGTTATANNSSNNNNTNNLATSSSNSNNSCQLSPVSPPTASVSSPSRKSTDTERDRNITLCEESPVKKTSADIASSGHQSSKDSSPTRSRSSKKGASAASSPNGNNNNSSSGSGRRSESPRAKRERHKSGRNADKHQLSHSFNGSGSSASGGVLAAAAADDYLVGGVSGGNISPHGSRNSQIATASDLDMLLEAASAGAPTTNTTHANGLSSDVDFSPDIRTRLRVSPQNIGNQQQQQVQSSKERRHASSSIVEHEDVTVSTGISPVDTFPAVVLPNQHQSSSSDHQYGSHPTAQAPGSARGGASLSSRLQIQQPQSSFHLQQQQQHQHQQQHYHQESSLLDDATTTPRGTAGQYVESAHHLALRHHHQHLQQQSVAGAQSLSQSQRGSVASDVAPLSSSSTPRRTQTTPQSMLYASPRSFGHGSTPGASESNCVIS